MTTETYRGKGFLSLQLHEYQIQKLEPLLLHTAKWSEVKVTDDGENSEDRASMYNSIAAYIDDLEMVRKCLKAKFTLDIDSLLGRFYRVIAFLHENLKSLLSRQTYVYLSDEYDHEISAVFRDIGDLVKFCHQNGLMEE